LGEITKIGTSSFTMEFKIHKQNGQLLTNIENTYVSYDRIKEKSIKIPEHIRKLLA
jgi:acyl-CoA thioesterase FadM